MNTTIHLDPALVPAALRGSYSGRKFKAVVCETLSIPGHAGLWEGGSRTVYSAIEPATGREIRVSSNAAPWDPERRNEQTVTLSPSFVVVSHSIFQGKDMGLTFYVHPDVAAKMLPAPVELSEIDKLVLSATVNYKSSYAGRDRYQTAKHYAYGQLFPTREAWELAKESLASRGLLNKAGAITPAGRNAYSQVKGS